jgi:hypothetical protein
MFLFQTASDYLIPDNIGLNVSRLKTFTSKTNHSQNTNATTSADDDVTCNMQLPC